MGKIEKAVQWAIDIANDNTHGYSQGSRWGPDYDCSSLVISAWQQAGVPVKTAGATYTGNMYQVFKQNGFADISALVNFASGTGLVRGDVLLNHSSHTCLYIGDGKVVNARTDLDGISGDSSAQEIRIQSYWNFPWDCILRFGESETTPTIITDETGASEPIVAYHTKGVGIAGIQGMLKYLGYNLGWYGIDGDNGGKGSYTNLAIEQAVSRGELRKEDIKYLEGIK